MRLQPFLFSLFKLIWRDKEIGLIRVFVLAGMLGIYATLFNSQLFVNAEEVLPYGSVPLQSEVIPAIRGSILDRNGVVLAVTAQAHTVFADQVLVTDPVGQARKLAPVLELDPAELAEKLTGDRRYVVLKRNVTPLVWERISLMGLNGIYEETVLSRVYPEGTLAANVLGFVNWEGVGAGGLESSLNEILAGSSGMRQVTRVGGLEKTSFIEKAAVDGQHVQLTIDRDIQWVAQQAIAEKVKEAGAESGTVIVLNPKTGEILAMATAPTFDPNNVANANPKNLGNRAMSDAFEPGSTGKIITMATVIEEDVAETDSKFKVPDKLKRGVETYNDHDNHKDLNLTLTGILAQSSNVGTIMASELLPNKESTMHSYWSKFGIGQASGLNFPGENPGYLKPLDEWDSSTAPTLAFGQGYSVNSLQAANIFSTIANDGIRITPNLVAGFLNNEGEFIAAEAPETETVVSPSTASDVREMLESVVSDSGTAPMAKIPGYRVAGKTGTAQMFDQNCGCFSGYVASFIGMAPTDEPELVVAVSLVKPVNGHYGGALAGPVFKRVMTFALQQMRIPPTATEKARLKVKW